MTSKGFLIDNYNDIEKIKNITNEIKKLDINDPKRNDLKKQIDIIIKTSRKNNSNLRFQLIIFIIILILIFIHLIKYNLIN